MSLRSSHLVGDHRFDCGSMAVTSASTLCQDRVFSVRPNFGSAPRDQAIREHRWRLIEHLTFECPGISRSGLGGSLAVTFLRDDLLRAVLDLTLPRRYCLQLSFRSSACCGSHGLSCPVPPRPYYCTGTSSPSTHEVAVYVSCRGTLAWCVVCGAQPPASVRIRVGKPLKANSPSCFVVRPVVVTPPAVRHCICLGAAPCACSCPSLCAGAMCPIPAWIWCNVRVFVRFFVLPVCPGWTPRLLVKWTLLCMFDSGLTQGSFKLMYLLPSWRPSTS